MFTARGIPVPGAFLTQFFINGEADNSVSKIAERMYLDGYDMRHFASMSFPVITKNLVIDSYLLITGNSTDVYGSISEREYQGLNRRLKREKMMFISNAVATTGNVVKFISPPNCGNPCALNMPQWLEMIRSSINMVRASMRDKTAETIMENRIAIDENWKRLMTEN